MVTVAAAHLEPIWMDRKATIARAAEAIAGAAAEGVDLLVFPEAFVPGFPYWINLGVPPPLQQSLWLALHGEALVLDGTEGSQDLDPVLAAARDHGITVVLGATERSGQQLYNVQIVIGSDGDIVGWRRKLVPTLFERTVWSAADATNLEVFPTNPGPLGALMCYEHIHHLIRHAIAQQRPVYMASSWPGFDPALGIDGGFAQRAALLSASFALMAQVPTIAASHPVTACTFDAVSERVGRSLDPDPSGSGGRSAIYDARGTVLAETRSVSEPLVMAEIDASDALAARWVADPVGHSARAELLQLHVERAPYDPTPRDGRSR